MASGAATPPPIPQTDPAFERPPESMTIIVWKRFRRHRLAVLGGAALAVLLICSFSAPLIARHILHESFDEQDLSAMKLAPGAEHPAETDEWGNDRPRPEAGRARRHWLGTDDLGRDHLVRLLYGGRISMSVGLLAAIFATVIGTSIGVVAGYYGGWLDSILMRFTDAMLSIPILPMMIIISSVDLQKVGLGFLTQTQWGSVVKIIFVVILFEWMGVARLVRGSVLTLKERDFVTAARAAGAGPVRIMAVHLIPNAIAPIVVSATLAIGSIILYESVLSFLTLGIQPPVPSWGSMLTHAQENFDDAWWLAVFPGVLIWITVTCFNFLGDGLRDAMDPKYVMAKK